MEDKIETLIDNLKAKTINKEANWERVGNGDQFSLTLKSGKVLVDKYITSQSSILYTILITNNKGDMIYQTNARQNISGEKNIKNYQIIKELHESIKRAYFKVDETIDGLLGEIDEKGKIGTDNSLPF